MYVTQLIKRQIAKLGLKVVEVTGGVFSELVGLLTDPFELMWFAINSASKSSGNSMPLMFT
jgi:hypothetical protein